MANIVNPAKEKNQEFRESGTCLDLETKALKKALQDKDLMEKTTSLMKKMYYGKPVNINPLPELPAPEMRLWSIDGNYFESLDKALRYCITNKISAKKLNVIDYYRNLAGRFDVIRKSSNKTSILYTAVDRDGYGLYNNEISIYRGEFVWEYNYGSIRELYKPFKERGVNFENDVYGKIDEDDRQILKYCIENNLFNMGHQYIED